MWQLHSKGPENHFEGNVLFLNKICCQFRTLSETFLVFSRDFISKIVKTALCETTKKLERICLKIFHNHCPFLCKKHSVFPQRQFNGFVKLHSTCPEEFVETIFYCLLFVTFSNLEQRILWLLAKTYEQWFRSCILRSHRSILMGFLGKKASFLNHFWTLSRNSSALRQNILGRVIKTVFYVSKKTIEGETWFTKFFLFLSFLDVER